MAERPAMISGARVEPTLLAGLRDDLKRKQELLAAASRCLADEQSYRFFCHLANVSAMEPGKKDRLLNQLAAMGSYGEHEMGAIRRLVMGDGATAFKELVDLVREIRVEQEIEAMLR